MLQDLRADRVKPVYRDHVVRELRMGRRIEYRLREDPLPLCQSRHYAEPGDAGSQPRTLPVREKERLIFLNRTTDRGAVLIAPVLRFRPGLGKEIARVE